MVILKGLMNICNDFMRNTYPTNYYSENNSAGKELFATQNNILISGRAGMTGAGSKGKTMLRGPFLCTDPAEAR